MTRVCLACGVTFDGKPGQTLCSTCAAASRAGSVIRQRVCRQCGITFDGGPRAWYCPDCRADRRRAQSADARKRKAAGKTRKIGSTDICIVCGGGYTVAGGNQHYCPACAPEAIKAIDRQHAIRWAAENIDIQLRKEQRQAAAAKTPCVICGTLFAPARQAITCSAACSAALAKRNMSEAGKRNRDARNAYQRARYAAKRAAMTPAELAEYRKRVNKKHRENYRKRKDKNND